MPKHLTIRRYKLLLDKIKSGTYPSREILYQYLKDNDFDISLRTMERDIEYIRDAYGIEIKFDKAENGYFIFNKEDYEIESYLRFFEIVNTAELLTESLAESKDSLKYLHFDDSSSLKGIENLKVVLNAIRRRHIIEFTHTNFWRGDSKKHRVKPYLLKEYQNRWYIVGQFEDNYNFFNFGIDRISDLKVLSETFKRNNKDNPAELFDDVIGIVHSISDVQKIVLSFTHDQAKYIKTLPIHHSQEITENENECIVEIHVKPNYELIQKILSWGKEVKVLEPKSLADEIKSILKESLKQYK